MLVRLPSWLFVDLEMCVRLTAVRFILLFVKSLLVALLTHIVLLNCWCWLTWILSPWPSYAWKVLLTSRWGSIVVYLGGIGVLSEWYRLCERCSLLSWCSNVIGDVLASLILAPWVPCVTAPSFAYLNDCVWLRKLYGVFCPPWRINWSLCRTWLRFDLYVELKAPYRALRPRLLFYPG